MPPWAWIVGALVLGLALGGIAPLMMARRRKGALPLRRTGESPAERARELQVALEREAIRFAPGRADHTETVLDLEERLRVLMRRV